MTDNMKVQLNHQSKIKDSAGYSYTFDKYNDKDGDSKMGKGEYVGSIIVNDYDGDGFDSHDGVINNNFGSVPTTLFDSMGKMNTSSTGYRDVSTYPANPTTGKTYADVKGTTSSASGLFTITSGKSEEFNLGSLAKQVISNKTATDNTNDKTNTTVNNNNNSQSAINPYALQMQSMGINPMMFGGLGTTDPSATTATLKPDMAKLNSAINSGYVNYSMALGGYGYGDYSGALAGINAPAAAAKMFNDILAAFKGDVTTNNNQAANNNGNSNGNSGTNSSSNAAAGNSGNAGANSSQVAVGAVNSGNELSDIDKKAKEAADKLKAEKEKAAKSGNNTDKNTGNNVITITKDEGLTQGLEDYAKVNKLINADITKDQWKAAIAEFRAIEAERTQNKGTNIFTENSTGKSQWHKHMVVKVGSINFSADEMSRLLKTIGATI